MASRSSRGRRKDGPEPRAGSAPVPGSPPGGHGGHLLALALVAALTLAAFGRVLAHGFVNWDDPDALVGNAALGAPGVLGWAFTTTHMSHYQPLAWLAWAAARAGFGASAPVHHALGVAFHLACAALVYVLAWRLLAPTAAAGARRAGAVAGAVLFAVHPLRVEVVAWASAFPYALALCLCLAATLFYLRSCEPGPPAARWRAASLLAYALSLLSRAAAPGFPLALLALDGVLGRLGPTAREARRALIEKAPFLLVALAAAWAEGSARRFATLEQVGLGYRLSAAATAPFLYLWRTLVPVGLSPLDALPLQARASWPALAAGLAGLLALSVLLLRSRARALAAAWLAYLALLAPAVGLAPTGLQASADRYAYFPGVVLALLGGGGLAVALQRSPRPQAWLAVSGLSALALAAATARQAGYWRDSRTLWSRAVAVDAANDVALYNLALALAEAGDEEGAAARYRETLRLVPEHEAARRNLARLTALRLEREAALLAQAGRLEEAVGRYGAALAEDPGRLRSRVSRGMALAELGRFREALPDLRLAERPGFDEPSVTSALGLALVDAGRFEEARGVLARSLDRHPGDTALAHNLARLLVTAPGFDAQARAEGLALARRVAEATGGADPRALETLASAYAATGDAGRAREIRARAIEAARRRGQPELAAEIARRDGR